MSVGALGLPETMLGALQSVCNSAAFSQEKTCGYL
jgi:hypothetical protein